MPQASTPRLCPASDHRLDLLCSRYDFRPGPGSARHQRLAPRRQTHPAPDRKDSAANEGPATGFYSPAPPGELAALATVAGLPEDTALAGVMTLGHAAEDPAVPAANLAHRRRPTSELIKWLR